MTWMVSDWLAKAVRTLRFCDSVFAQLSYASSLLQTFWISSSLHLHPSNNHPAKQLDRLLILPHPSHLPQQPMQMLPPKPFTLLLPLQHRQAVELQK